MITKILIYSKSNKILFDYDFRNYRIQYGLLNEVPTVVIFSWSSGYQHPYSTEFKLSEEVYNQLNTEAIDLDIMKVFIRFCLDKYDEDRKNDRK